MPSRAIVIGVDQYLAPIPSLKGAVRDALSFADWLMSPKGGKLDPANVTLLLAPAAESPTTARPFSVPTDDNMIAAINAAFSAPAGIDDRFYFYFAGHGLLSRISQQNESGITASNFTEELTNKSLKLGTIYEKMAASAFNEQYFFIDACRNIPWMGEFLLGFVPRPGGGPRYPAPDQYIMYATSPGLTSTETRVTPGDERGVFTSQLVAALKGAGVAKLFNDDNAYLVRWNSSFEQVARAMAATRPTIAGPDGLPYFQAPRAAGEHGANDPVLIQIPEGDVSPVSLTLRVEPAPEVDTAGVSITPLVGPCVEHNPIRQSPLVCPLPPRTYKIVGRSEKRIPERTSYVLNLYSDGDLTIRFVDRPPGDPQPPEPPPPPGVTPPGEPPPGTVDVRALDPYSLIRIRDSAGNLVASGFGEKLTERLPDGVFEADVIGPDGPVRRESFVSEKGGFRGLDMELQQPSEAVVETLGKLGPSPYGGGNRVNTDGTAALSELIPRAAYVRMSTLLALAGSASHEDWHGNGNALRSIGALKIDPRKWKSGVVLLSADEREGNPSTRLAYQVESGDGPGQNIEGRPMLEDRRMIQGSFEASGNQSLWVTVAFRDAAPVQIATLALEAHATLVVVNREKSGEIHAYQFMQPLGAEAFKNAPDDFPAAYFPKLRVIELLQRAIESRRRDYAVELAMRYLKDDWYDPIAAALASYQLLRAGRFDEPRDAGKQLIGRFPWFGDGYFLSAACAFAGKREKDAHLFLEGARKASLPILSESLGLLLSTTGDADLRESLDSPDLISGWLWNARALPRESGRHESFISPLSMNPFLSSRPVVDMGKSVYINKRDDDSKLEI